MQDTQIWAGYRVELSQHKTQLSVKVVRTASAHTLNVPVYQCGEFTFEEISDIEKIRNGVRWTVVDENGDTTLITFATQDNGNFYVEYAAPEENVRWSYTPNFKMVP
jgi:hypothetical protein